MSGSASSLQYFIGWDVGGWNCDRNRESRDALVILDDSKTIVGRCWRGNLKETINTCSDTQDWLAALFQLCLAEPPTVPFNVTLAIDIPLGFSEAFHQLLAGIVDADLIQESASNPYLFRQTEHYLFQHGLQPLSPIKDMIGSQATKGMHVVAKFAPTVKSAGVWTDGQLMTVIEAYPSACKRSNFIQTQLRSLIASQKDEPPYTRYQGEIAHPDEVDALICALLAYAFVHDQDQLAPPCPGVSKREGWIWVPKDGLTLD